MNSFGCYSIAATAALLFIFLREYQPLYSAHGFDQFAFLGACDLDSVSLHDDGGLAIALDRIVSVNARPIHSVFLCKGGSDGSFMQFPVLYQ